MQRARLASASLAAIILASAVQAAEVSDVTVTGHVFQPPHLQPPDVAMLRVPDGFTIERFAEGLHNTRTLAVSPEGRVYVTRREEGDVLMLEDKGPGKPAGEPVTVASRSGMHGITFHDGKVYLITVKEVFVADVLPDGRFGPLAMIIHDLPDAGQHNDRMIAVGPEGMLYISAGSTCNECIEPNPENATILRASLDGKTRTIFAAGLRNTISFGWQPATGALWGMDNGMDWLGDDAQPEELNRIEQGKVYGWPFIYADNQINPHQTPPGKLSIEEWRAKSVPMVMGYTPHAAPMQMAFYTGGQFPAEYRGDAFVAMRGSWNRKPPSGFEIVRIHYDKGEPAAITPFVTGFITPQGQAARPFGVAVAKNGALLFSDDQNGVIYRVSHPGTPDRPAAVAAADAISRKPVDTPPVPLALARIGTGTGPGLTVQSAFRPDASIPAIYSNYDQDASMPLSWSGAPATTRSYAVLIEDPDAAAPKPFVHWLAWNIPSDVTSLREGLQKQEQLRDPEGLRQGVNSSGSVGYKGPRPPAGDPPHHYHVQVMALDRTIDVVAGADRDTVLAEIKGHVLAQGELVGTFARPDNPPKP